MTDAVLWVLGQEGTEQGARTSCTGCALEEIWCGECPVELQQVPELAEEAKRVLALYARCTAYHALPGPGSIEDQEDREMRLLDLVGGLVAKHQEERRRAEDEARKAYGGRR